MSMFVTDIYNEKAIDVASQRLQVASNNLSNLAAPNFHCQRVTGFEDAMREAIEKWTSPDDAIAQEGEDDMVAAEPTVETAPEAGVNMQQEMANMAKAQILYNALSKQVSGYYSSLKYVVDNSGR